MEEILSQTSEPGIDGPGADAPAPAPVPALPAAADAPAEETLSAHDRAAIQVAATLRQIVQAGDEIAGIVVEPGEKEAFEKAFRALPQQICPEQVRMAIPIEADEKVQGLRIVTRSQIEAEFLHSYFGPENQGGTGTVPRLDSYLNNANSPVRISTEFLRNLYLSQALDRCEKRIVRPGESHLQLPGGFGR